MKYRDQINISKIILIFTANERGQLMQKFILVTLAITALSLVRCSSDSDKINKDDFRSLIVEAIAGDSEANAKLPGFLTSKHISKTDFNNLSIESLNINNKTFYSVLLEYYDPTLNLFAIYDDHMNMYLLDKSLNGYLSSEWNVIGNRKFVFVQERFLTKDVLSLDRLSIYEVFENSSILVYRSLSRFVKNNRISSQTVESIKENFIITKITGFNDGTNIEHSDTFYYNPNSKKYLSKFNLFNNFAKEEIQSFSWTIIKPHITADFVSSFDDTTTKAYKISLDNNWQKNSKYIENRYLKQPLKGVKYSNINHLSSFTVLQIPRSEDAEKYCPYNLTETSSGNYRIKATEVVEVGKNYVQIFEHTCGGTKYLLIFDCPKSVYLENRKTFATVINSFSIDC